jgi:hypothetical protein
VGDKINGQLAVLGHFSNPHCYLVGLLVNFTHESKLAVSFGIVSLIDAQSINPQHPLLI